mmetsp:Transcript_23477/g.79940  ORF Transcript_23477/g.79940 Transcript_23477/m.79940 type:complete len:631 (+) Transcript_23477:1146-3038(+)
MRGRLRAGGAVHGRREPLRAPQVHGGPAVLLPRLQPRQGRPPDGLGAEAQPPARDGVGERGPDPVQPRVQDKLLPRPLLHQVHRPARPARGERGQGVRRADLARHGEPRDGAHDVLPAVRAAVHDVGRGAADQGAHARRARGGDGGRDVQGRERGRHGRTRRAARRGARAGVPPGGGAERGAAEDGAGTQGVPHVHVGGVVRGARQAHLPGVDAVPARVHPRAAEVRGAQGRGAGREPGRAVRPHLRRPRGAHQGHPRLPLPAHVRPAPHGPRQRRAAGGPALRGAALWRVHRLARGFRGDQREAAAAVGGQERAAGDAHRPVRGGSHARGRLAAQAEALGHARGSAGAAPPGGAQAALHAVPVAAGGGAGAAERGGAVPVPRRGQGERDAGLRGVPRAAAPAGAAQVAGQAARARARGAAGGRVSRGVPARQPLPRLPPPRAGRACPTDTPRPTAPTAPRAHKPRSCARRPRALLGRLVVGRRHERHFGHRRVVHLVAHLHLELGPRLGQRLVDVAHGDVLLQARGEAARGYLPDLVAVEVQHLGVLPGRGAGGDEAHAALRHALRHVLGHRLAAQEVELLAAALADGPRQARLHGADVLLEVVAVQAQARLEPEGVARAQAAPPNLVL